MPLNVHINLFYINQYNYQNTHLKKKKHACQSSLEVTGKQITGLCFWSASFALCLP